MIALLITNYTGIRTESHVKGAVSSLNLQNLFDLILRARQSEFSARYVYGRYCAEAFILYCSSS